jgi:hypothetical protein
MPFGPADVSGSGVQYKSAFVLLHKLRESLIVQREETPLSGEVEMDGGYVGGHVRAENKKEDRLDRRLAEHQGPDKRCILVMREKHPPQAVAPQPGGASRTLSFVIRREHQADVGTLARRFIAPGTSISADESDAYDLLHGYFLMHRVNHACEYRADDGTTNNKAESYFARFRRMEIGQTHKFGLRYLANYARPTPTLPLQMWHAACSWRSTVRWSPRCATAKRTRTSCDPGVASAPCPREPAGTAGAERQRALHPLGRGGAAAGRAGAM